MNFWKLRELLIHLLHGRLGVKYDAVYVPCPSCGSGKWRVINLRVQDSDRSLDSSHGLICLGLICTNCGDGFAVHARLWGLRWARKRWPEGVRKG